MGDYIRGQRQLQDMLCLCLLCSPTHPVLRIRHKASSKLETGDLVPLPASRPCPWQGGTRKGSMTKQATSEASVLRTEPELCSHTTPETWSPIPSSPCAAEIPPGGQSKASHFLAHIVKPDLSIKYFRKPRLVCKYLPCIQQSPPPLGEARLKPWGL